MEDNKWFDGGILIFNIEKDCMRLVKNLKINME